MPLLNTEDHTRYVDQFLEHCVIAGVGTLQSRLNPKNAMRRFPYSLNPAIHLISIHFHIETRFRSSVCLYAITRYGFLIGFPKNTFI